MLFFVHNTRTAGQVVGQDTARLIGLCPGPYPNNIERGGSEWVVRAAWPGAKAEIPRRFSLEKTPAHSSTERRQGLWSLN